MRFAAGGPVYDNLCIGIEAVGCIGSGHMMSVSFAPFSGTCFIQHEDGFTIQTKVLPSIHEVSEVYAWIHVTGKGGIRFLRQLKDTEVEDAGLLKPEMLPNWIQAYFGCIDFWLSDLAFTVDVSVEYSGCTFPSDMSIFNTHWNEIQNTWCH